ncbi:FAD-linked oxidase C-terminal domain-containing protein [Neobacillus sp. SuZ13]|uniref:FAD-binding oxidoreductase n=1 Tax=Neobacillus sp. SuZ13 TaxID=3047875 RepID=UPI0024C07370|nr:FAD-linked oxidase C-terminal domain-containing protein [Neobacillus sp. SuZ13]WHY69101.1 FAD-linked oxidase C-terminal domain-containing protein [Neobacillus sp. SuZ13]
MEWKQALRNLLPAEQISENPTILEHHSKDESYHQPVKPDIVVFPKNKQEISEIMKIAYKYHIPVVPFGVGSSLEGHPIPVSGGISMDFQLMNHIIEVRENDLLVKVQPGVTRKQLNKALKKYGLFFPVDPGADATIGGMTSTNASGTTTVKYGAMKDVVRGLEVVLANGEIVNLGGLAAKSSSGYNLTPLFVGSEGTLGVFTGITLKVFGIPEATLACRAVFPSVDHAIKAANAMVSSGIPIARIELVDARSMKQVNIHNETTYPEQTTLFMEFHGNEEGIKADVKFAKELADLEGCSQFEYETDSLKKAKLWEARHTLAYAFKHGYPAKKNMSTDVCVPLSKLPDAISHASLLLEEYGLIGGIVGHVGDGNFHALIMIDPNDTVESDKAHTVNLKIVEFAIDCGGTATGEHGIGLGKIDYLYKEHASSIHLMKMIKDQFDPLGILNPGKMFK